MIIRMMGQRAKQFIILFLLVFFSFIFWLSLATLLPNLSWDLTPQLISVFVSAFVFTVLWAVVLALFERLSSVVGAWAVVSYGGVAWFQSHVFIIAASLLFFFGIIGFLRARSEMRNTLHGGLWRPLRKGVPIVITFFIVVVASAAYLKAPSSTLTLEEIIPKKFFETALFYTEPVIQSVDPDFARDKTLEEYLKNKILRKAPNASEVEIGLLVRETIRERQEVFGSSLSADQVLSDVLYRGSINFLNRTVVVVNDYLPIAFAVALFVSLRVLAFPFCWLSILIAIAVLKIFRRFGIVGLREIPANVVLYTFTNKI